MTTAVDNGAIALPELLCQSQASVKSLCMLFSILNVIDTPENRCAFLQSKTDEYDVSYFVRWLKLKFPDWDVEHDGLNSYHIKCYLDHLREIGVLVSYTWMSRRGMKMSKIFRPKHPTQTNQEVMNGKSFVLLGYTTSDKASHKIAFEVATGNNKRKRIKGVDYDEESPIDVYRHHMYDAVVDATKGFSLIMEKCCDKSAFAKRTEIGRTKAAKAQGIKKRQLPDDYSDVTEHAISLKVIDDKGNAFLCDPGKKVVRLVNETTMKSIVECLLCTWTILEIKLVFKEEENDDTKC